jgi:hypothetical protein
MFYRNTGYTSGQPIEPLLIQVPALLRYLSLSCVYGLLLLGAACTDVPPDREGRTQQIVESWIDPVDASPWRGEAPAKPVAVYADRSRSMRGFLDPAYPTRTDYRSVIDGLHARLSPQRVYGFGSRVRLERNAGLDLLGNRDFYADGDTEMEEALDSISTDARQGWTHIVIGDGRRSNPDLAHRQFVRMRALALRWTESGGTFLVAVSRAPFRPVVGDPSGCYALTVGAQPDSVRQCPLYAFAFAAPGDGVRVAAVLSDLFQNMWAFAPATAPEPLVALRAREIPEGTTFDPVWHSTSDSTVVPKVEAGEPATQPLRLRIVPGDTASAAGHLLGRLLSGSVAGSLWARPITADSQGSSWSRQDGRTGSVRLGGNGLELDVYSPGGDDCDAAAEGEPCGTLYRVELRAAGAPDWLTSLEARQASDRERTFGLGRLFEPFRARAAAAPPLLKAYLLVR